MAQHRVIKRTADIVLVATILFTIALAAMWVRSYSVSDYWAWGRDGWMRLVRLDSGSAWVEMMSGRNSASQIPFQHQTKAAQPERGGRMDGLSVDTR